LGLCHGIELTHKLGYGRSAIIVLMGVGISGILSYGAIAQAKAREATSLRNRAIATNKAKTEFMATISHELRTPLNAIVGMTEGLKNQVFGPTNSKQLQALDTIENSSSHLLSLSSYLKAKGYRILLAKTQESALELAQSEHPQVMLMDLQMSQTDALDILRSIRKDLNLVDLPIIALIPVSTEEERERILQAGVNDYLSKPVKLKQLVGCIQNLLSVSPSSVL
jgi:CheY-like chemotaxis protein